MKVNEIKNKGITLIALVITIIVLLILAGVTIATLTGDNGILARTNKAKKETEIAEEKEKIELASTAESSNNKQNELTKSGLQNQLDKIAGKQKTEVIKDGKNSYIVTFLETNRNYKIDENWNVEGPVDIEKIEDEYAGDITKNGTLDGSESKPYKINCIEDLVDFSLKSKNTDFAGLNIIVTRNLDFESDLSYNNSSSKIFGDLNNDNNIDELMIELTIGKGFSPISQFSGTFNGKNNEIKNIFINSNERDVGFFSQLSNAKVKNLKLSGNIIQTVKITQGTAECASIAGTADNSCVVENCTNNIEINVNGGINIGGIIGSNEGKIISCINVAKIISENIKTSTSTGGITGKNNGYIINCYNEGSIISESGCSVAGIDGGNYSSSSNIYNCYNNGDIISKNKNDIFSVAGGIYGYMANSISSLNIYNCYNSGKLKAYWRQGSIIAILRGITPNVNNCYYLNQNLKYEYDNSIACTEEYMKGTEIINKLNQFIDNNDQNIDTTGWLKWKKGINGYPTLDYTNSED